MRWKLNGSGQKRKITVSFFLVAWWKLFFFLGGWVRICLMKSLKEDYGHNYNQTSMHFDFYFTCKEKCFEFWFEIMTVCQAHYLFFLLTKNNNIFSFYNGEFFFLHSPHPQKKKKNLSSIFRRLFDYMSLSFIIFDLNSYSLLATFMIFFCKMSHCLYSRLTLSTCCFLVEPRWYLSNW